MKEHGILFSAPMVRAILDGRKTQTRRVVKYPGTWRQTEAGATERAYYTARAGVTWVPATAPHGPVGRRLWVRETWYCDHAFAKARGTPDEEAEWGSEQYMYYRADVPSGRFDDAAEWGEQGGRWRPAIHMPRWASRITLEVTGVRVERVQSITEEDARAEGVESRAAYMTLWDEINGAGSSAKNPLVWVYEFRRAS